MPAVATQASMTTETHQRLALQLRMAGEALITSPTPDTYGQLSRAFAALARAGLAGEAMDLGNDALSDICDRYEETAVLSVTELEAEWIRASLASIDDALPLVAVADLKQAIKEVEVYCASVGA